jgi:TonB family protein
MRLFLCVLSTTLLLSQPLHADQPSEPSGDAEAPVSGEAQPEAAPQAEAGAQPEDAGAPAVQSEVPEVDMKDIKSTHRVPPKYPSAAKAGRIEGVCKVRIFIDEKGVPTEARPEACPKVFRDAATTAALKWRFEPHKVDGQASKAQFILSLRFQMR